ncbi:hypothetical protein FBU30_009738 [Linnemannia zychae]|nr:hypothetical protein FBU30_009738 [Linnemannia zychae]
MLLKIVIILFILVAAAAAAAADLPPNGLAFDHIFIVFLENTDYDLANTDPVLRSYFSRGVTLDNYHGVAHPSQPNYLAAIAGDYFEFDDDHVHHFDPSYLTVVDLLEEKGLTWRAYQENMPNVCYPDANYQRMYFRKHNPFMSFDNIAKNISRCQHVVPATQLYNDLNIGFLPNYSFYSPNIQNDGHDTTVAFAARWLTDFLDPLLANPTFNQNTLVVVTFDEAEDRTDETNHVLGILLGDAVQHIANTTDSTFLTQYSLISTITANWGLNSLGRNDVDPEVSNVFDYVARATGYTNLAVPYPPALN